MSKDKLISEWEAMAATWIREARDGPNANRNGLLDGPVLAACGDVTGLRALDCGCGEGRFCRLLTQAGAGYVLGLDLCGPMIDAARELQSGPDEYRVANAEDLSFLSDGDFDVAVSYLNQCDLADFAANTREVFRVLKPGGRFVIANLHPMLSATGAWQKSPEGEKQHVMLDRYFDEGERHWKILGIDITNFHRTLETYLRVFLESGFHIAGIVEPTVTPENLKKYPELATELRVPNFIVYTLVKA